MATSTSYVLDHKQILQAAEPERPNRYQASGEGNKVVSPGKQQYLSNGAPSPSNKLSPKHIMSILNSSKTQLDVAAPGTKDDSQTGLACVEEEKEVRIVKKASPKSFAQFVGSSRVMAVQREASAKPKKPAEPTVEELEQQRKQRMIRRNSIGSMLTSSFRRSPTAEAVKEPSPTRKVNGYRSGHFHTVSGTKAQSIAQHASIPSRTMSARGPGSMVDVNFRNPYEKKFDKPHAAEDDGSFQGSLDDSDSPLSSPVITSLESPPRVVPGVSDGEQPLLHEAKGKSVGEDSEKADDNLIVEVSQKDDMEAELAALKAKFSDLQHQSVKKDEDMKKLEGRLKESQACAKEYENAYKKLNDANTKLHEVNENLSTEVKNLKGSLTDSQVEAGSLKAHLERLERECRNVKKSLSSLCGERDTLKLSLDKVLHEQEDSRKDAEDARKMLSDARERCTCQPGQEAGSAEYMQGLESAELKAEEKGEGSVKDNGKDAAEREVRNLKDEVILLQKRIVDLEALLGLNEQLKEASEKVDSEAASELGRKFKLLRRLFESEKMRSKSMMEKIEDEKMSHLAEIAQHKQHLGHLQTSIRKMDAYVQQHMAKVQSLVQMASSAEMDDLFSKAKDLQQMAEKCSSDIFGHQKLTFKGVSVGIV